MNTRRLITAALLSVLLPLAGCGGRNTDEKKNESGAVVETRGTPRPSAPLGLYAGFFLGGGTAQPNDSAVKGVEAQVRLHAEYDPLEDDDTRLLLEEFGTLLQIDIPDLLNRSPDRPTVLTQYTEALRNITTRSERTSQDLATRLETLQKTARQERTAVADLQRRYDKAFKDGDFAAVGSLQDELTKTQVQEAATQSAVRGTQNLLSAYEELLEIATLRLDAIEKNREVLIAGLKVVEVPGIVDLGLIEEQTRRR